MPNDMIRYDLLVQEALCGVVSKVLTDIARNGLPGDHHFYITFRTHAPGVRLSSRMRELYPEEMTIILQHQFEDLKVSDHGFEVGLSFKGIPELLLIPFDALTGFFDPSVQFSLKFEPQVEADDAPVVGEPVRLPTKPHALPAATSPVASSVTPILAGAPVGGSAKPVNEPPAAPSEPVENDGADGKAKVVSIDAFRKKP